MVSRGHTAAQLKREPYVRVRRELLASQDRSYFPHSNGGKREGTNPLKVTELGRGRMGFEVHFLGRDSKARLLSFFFFFFSGPISFAERREQGELAKIEGELITARSGGHGSQHLSSQVLQFLLVTGTARLILAGKSGALWPLKVKQGWREGQPEHLGMGTLGCLCLD